MRSWLKFCGDWLYLFLFLSFFLSKHNFFFHVVEEALAHPYLARLHDIADEPICPEPFLFDFEQQPLDEEQIKDLIYKEAISLNPEYA